LAVETIAFISTSLVVQGPKKLLLKNIDGDAGDPGATTINAKKYLWWPP
jgi:hypothetical protein